MKALCLSLVLLLAMAVSGANAEDTALLFSDPMWIGGSGFDVVLEAIPDHGGGLLLYGYTGSHDGSFSDNEAQSGATEFLLKLDADGNRAFCFYHSGYNTPCIRAISAKPEDAGYTLFLDAYSDTNGPEVKILSLDAEGRIASELSCRKGDEAINLRMFAAAKGGQLLLSGEAQEISAYGTIGTPFLALVDVHGNTRWRRVYGDMEDYEIKHAAQTDGGYFLCGTVHRTSTPFVAKVSDDGELLFCKPHAIGDGRFFLQDMITAGDGGLLTLGVDHASPSGAQWLWRYDAEGSLLWAKELSGDSALFFSQIHGRAGTFLLGGLAETSTTAVLERFDDGGNAIGGIEYPLGGSERQVLAFAASAEEKGWLLISDGDVRVVPFTIEAR